MKDIEKILKLKFRSQDCTTTNLKHQVITSLISKSTENGRAIGKRLVFEYATL